MEAGRGTAEIEIRATEADQENIVQEKTVMVEGVDFQTPPVFQRSKP